jgi:hypothetical protein
MTAQQHPTLMGLRALSWRRRLGRLLRVLKMRSALVSGGTHAANAQAQGEQAESLLDSYWVTSMKKKIVASTEQFAKASLWPSIELRTFRCVAYASTGNTSVSVVNATSEASAVENQIRHCSQYTQLDRATLVRAEPNAQCRRAVPVLQRRFRENTGQAFETLSLVDPESNCR